MTIRAEVRRVLCGGALSVLAFPAMGQSAGDDALQEIVVTARGVQERLQDVPAALTVFTSETIEQAGIRSARDFIQLTPGVSLVAATAEVGDVQVSIRGLNGTRDAENNVALVVDGVQKTNRASIFQNQGELAQIEVLKGPQGALYGRNASAGAIVVTTRGPGEELEFTGTAALANDSSYDAFARISGPLGDAGAGFVLSADFEKSDGFYRNTFMNSAAFDAYADAVRSVHGVGADVPRGSAASVDNYERWNAYGRLVLPLGPDTDLDLKARYGRNESAAINFNIVFALPPFAPLIGPAAFLDVNDHQFVHHANVAPRNEQDTVELSALVNHEMSFATFRSFLAYNRIDNEFFADGNAGGFGFFWNEPTCRATVSALTGYPVQTPGFIGTVPGPPVPPGGQNSLLVPYTPTTCDGVQYQRRTQEDWSFEARLIGPSDAAVRWQGGVYYLRIDRRTCVNLGLDTGQGIIPECFTTDSRNPTEQLADDKFTTDVYSVFGSLDFDLAESWVASVALRYDREERDVRPQVPVDARTRWVGAQIPGIVDIPNGTETTPANNFLNPGLNPVLNPDGLVPVSATFSQIQPKLSVVYQPVDNLSIYASWGIGFKSGGFNSSGTEAVIRNFFNLERGSNLNLPDQYEKERTSAFELGLKGRGLDGRLGYELAGYYTDVKDMQIFEFFTGPFGLLRVVSNVSKVEIYGAEASLDFAITDGWSVFGSANVTESEIKRNFARPNTEGNSSPYTPDYTINLGTQIVQPLRGNLDWTARLDYRLTGPTWFSTLQERNTDVITRFGPPTAPLLADYSRTRRDAFGVVNLRVGVESETWRVTVFADNLFDKDYLHEVIPAAEAGGAFISPGGLRRYGIEVGVRF